MECGRATLPSKLSSESMSTCVAIPAPHLGPSTLKGKRLSIPLFQSVGQLGFSPQTDDPYRAAGWVNTLTSRKQKSRLLPPLPAGILKESTAQQHGWPRGCAGSARLRLPDPSFPALTQPTVRPRGGDSDWLLVSPSPTVRLCWPRLSAAL